jgi:hypothetical protein
MKCTEICNSIAQQEKFDPPQPDLRQPSKEVLMGITFVHVRQRDRLLAVRRNHFVKPEEPVNN